MTGRVGSGVSYRSPGGGGEPVAVSMSRLEAFSDGVIAVAITLLVLNIQVPVVHPHARHGCRTLGCELVDQWPVYAAYVVSFLTIGIIWINHHVMVRRLREPDHMILFLNLLLLMSIAVLPFATSLMAAYLRKSEGQHLAAAIYSGSFLVMAVFFTTLNRHLLLVKPDRLRERRDERCIGDSEPELGRIRCRRLGFEYAVLERLGQLGPAHVAMLWGTGLRRLLGGDRRLRLRRRPVHLARRLGLDFARADRDAGRLHGQRDRVLRLSLIHI